VAVEHGSRVFFITLAVGVSAWTAACESSSTTVSQIGGRDGAGADGGSSGNAATGGSSATAGASGTGGGGTAGAGGTAGGGSAGSEAGQGACDLSKPFSTPSLVEVVNGPAAERGFWLLSDQLTAFFASARNAPDGGPPLLDLFSTTRSNPVNVWSEPQRLAFSSELLDENSPVVTLDGLTLYYALNEGTGANIVRSDRSSTAVAFQAGTAVANINDPSAHDFPNWVSPDGKTLYFDSVRGGRYSVYVSTIGSGGFSTPQALTSLGDDTASAVLTQDERTVYFVSNRAGGRGEIDVWMAKRDSKTAAFGTPQNVTELNSPDDDWVSWISGDGCQVYLWRGTANSDILSASRGN
jgi:hypothetical protein